MNTRTLFTALLLTTGFLHTNARAEGWHASPLNGTLYIFSGVAADESFSVHYGHNTVVVRHYPSRQSRVIALSEVSEIVFYGDGDVDYFRNETSIPLTAFGGDGDDILVGGSGDDDLYGEDGFDELSGQDGNDFLHPGTDLLESRIDGGLGYDIGVTGRVATKLGYVNQVFLYGFDLGGQKGDVTQSLPIPGSGTPGMPRP